MSIRVAFSIIFFKICAFKLDAKFQSRVTTWSLKLSLHRQSVPFTCLSYLSSLSIFSLVSLSIPFEISSSNWRTWGWSKLGVGYEILIWMEGIATFWSWMTWASLGGTLGCDPKSCKIWGEGCLSNLLIITAIMGEILKFIFLFAEFYDWNWWLLVLHSRVGLVSVGLLKGGGPLLSTIVPGPNE